MSGIAKAKLIRLQNSPTFEFDLKKQPIIFQRGLFSRDLNPPQSDINIPRTCKVKCLVTGCRYVLYIKYFLLYN